MRGGSWGCRSSGSIPSGLCAYVEVEEHTCCSSATPLLCSNPCRSLEAVEMELDERFEASRSGVREPALSPPTCAESLIRA
eukprot:scaffold303448_cov35-Tisochrysis_lutea.AAC.1